jgi:hypothetical protein
MEGGGGGGAFNEEINHDESDTDGKLCIRRRMHAYEWGGREQKKEMR